MHLSLQNYWYSILERLKIYLFLSLDIAEFVNEKFSFSSISYNLKKSIVIVLVILMIPSIMAVYSRIPQFKRRENNSSNDQIMTSHL